MLGPGVSFPLHICLMGRWVSGLRLHSPEGVGGFGGTEHALPGPAI